MGKWRLTKHWEERSTFSLNMNPCPEPTAQLIPGPKLLLFPLTWTLSCYWPMTCKHSALPATAHVGIYFFELVICCISSIYSMFFYVTMETKFHLCYVINLLVCWWLDRGRKRGMMKCCFQELLTDNPKINISVFFFFFFFFNHQESIFNLQRAHFTKTNIIKNICWNIKFNQDRWRTVSY